MRLLARIVAIVAGLILVIIGGLCYWLYYYNADLPSIAELDQYVPATPSEIHVQSPEGLLSIRHVIPSNQLEKYLLSAVVATEGHPESRGPIREALASLRSGAQAHSQMYSLQLARGMIPSSHGLRRQIDELRLAQRIHRRFDQRQLLTIYMNRVYLGENCYGVEDGSTRYFGKHAADLSLDEAALLVGMIRAPSYHSPINHLDRAVQRRNWVIDQMVGQGCVSKQTQNVPEQHR